MTKLPRERMHKTFFGVEKNFKNSYIRAAPMVGKVMGHGINDVINI